MQTIQSQDQGYWLLTQGSALYLRESELPYGNAVEHGVAGLQGCVIGEFHQQPLWLVAEIPNDQQREYTSLRTQLYRDEDVFNLLNRGVALNYFFTTHRFCSKCGERNYLPTDEFAVECPKCGYRHYPVICPSIIVAVRRGKEILLANHRRHIGGIYTTLAGFVESGESLEQTVQREIFEEVGLKVTNIRYFGSQPWAFPNSLMVGFLADYESGEICLQDSEIHDAKWFRYDETLPMLPPEGTIARKLIKTTLALCAED
ncbi:NAD(+) diphosphatase [Gallibacterium trehalosifermentans]|uniref:NAD-capped RNA hydrolase NudC n=1 Tax=Gallibacterium trehalosifermentans TaxID=516935 RepID=A0ABV6H1D9_9PAST